MKSKNSNNIVKELISLAYMNFLRLLKTIKNHQIKFLKSCGLCGRSGSTPLPGTKHSDLSGCFFIAFYFNDFSVARMHLTLTHLWADERNTQIQSAQDKQYSNQQNNIRHCLADMVADIYTDKVTGYNYR